MSHCLVIIPTYNEKENIKELIDSINELSQPFHILIIDDNSPDGTGAIVKELQKKYKGSLFLKERSGKLGLGTAYIEGFKFALRRGYEFIFEMDADFSHDPDELINLYKACAEEGYDLAIGSRYIQGVNVVNWPMNRVLISYLASYYVKIITGMPITDATAGFKCYRREVLETIDLNKLRFIGYAFQIEMKFLTWNYGFKIKEVPIIFTDRSKGESKMSKKIFNEAIFGVVQMKIRSLFQDFHRKRLEVKY